MSSQRPAINLFAFELHTGMMLESLGVVSVLAVLLAICGVVLRKPKQLARERQELIDATERDTESWMRLAN